MAYRLLRERLGSDLAREILEYNAKPFNVKGIHDINLWYIKYAVNKVRERYTSNWSVVLRRSNPFVMSWLLSKMNSI